MTSNTNTTVSFSTGHPTDCTLIDTTAAIALDQRDIRELIRCRATHDAARLMAVQTMIRCEQEYKSRCNTMQVVRSGLDTSTQASRDAYRLCKAKDLIKTSGKWGQWTKVSGRHSLFVKGLLAMCVTTAFEPESALARAQRHCFAKHSAAVNVEPMTREGKAFLSMFSTLVDAVKAYSFNGSVCGFASREGGLLDTLAESANEALNYDLGGLDGGTCSAALCAVQEAYRKA